MILLPNMWKLYRSVQDRGINYNVILQRRALDIHCYSMGNPVAYRTSGQHHFPQEGSVFRVVHAQPYERERLIRDESKLLEEYLWPTIDLEELESLLGRPPEQW